MEHGFGECEFSVKRRSKPTEQRDCALLVDNTYDSDACVGEITGRLSRSHRNILLPSDARIQKECVLVRSIQTGRGRNGHATCSMYSERHCIAGPCGCIGCRRGTLTNQTSLESYQIGDEELNPDEVEQGSAFTLLMEKGLKLARIYCLRRF